MLFSLIYNDKYILTSTVISRDGDWRSAHTIILFDRILIIQYLLYSVLHANHSFCEKLGVINAANAPACCQNFKCHNLFQVQGDNY
jgi:hypothetical protein